jgi:hypothetical protein
MARAKTALGRTGGNDMKKIFFVLIFILGAVPVLALDLQPEALGRAIREYKIFSKIDNPDPMNHVVWKLYIFRSVTQSDHPTGAVEYLIAGLTPFPKDGFYVRLKINELYDYLRPIPKRGDVILAGGRIINRLHYETNLPKKQVVLKLLAMNLDGAVSLPREHFDPSGKATGLENAAKASSAGISR